MARGDSTGGSQCSWLQLDWKRASELSCARPQAAPVPTLVLPRLLVSPDRVPHGHRPAQRGQHLVPVCDAHATG